MTDQEDFVAAIREYGFDVETARRISEDTADQIPMPDGEYKFAVKPSSIEGQGIIAVGSIAPNEVVGRARIAGKRTPLGRFTNHTKAPNARMVMRISGDIDLVATQPIQRSEEVTVNYRQVGQAQRLPRVAQ